MATSRGGGATQCYSLSTRQADGAPVAVEEDAEAMAKPRSQELQSSHWLACWRGQSVAWLLG